MYMNNKLINDKKKIIVLSNKFWLKEIKKKVGIFFYFRSGPDPDQNDTDPQHWLL